MNTTSPVKIWRNQKKIRSLLGVKGKIATWTKVHVPPMGFIAQAPYIIVIMETDAGKRFTGQLVDSEEKHVHSGQPVQSVLRRTREPEEESIIPYGIKFKPI